MINDFVEEWKRALEENARNSIIFTQIEEMMKRKKIEQLYTAQ